MGCAGCQVVNEQCRAQLRKGGTKSANRINTRSPDLLDCDQVNICCCAESRARSTERYAPSSLRLPCWRCFSHCVCVQAMLSSDKNRNQVFVRYSTAFA